jgi:hypothetical protein
VTGTYTITVSPDFFSGKLDLQLFNVPPDVTGTILPNGAPVSITTTVPGQDARVTFNGTTGQRLSLRVTEAIYPYSFISALKPDGTILTAVNIDTQPPAWGAAPDGFQDTFTLPVTGTYTIVVDGYLGFAGTTTMSLYDVPTLATATATIGGPPTTATAAVPGHDAEVSFNGTAGQRISLKVTGPIDADLSIIRPNGQTLASQRIRQIGPTQAELFEAMLLPSTGTYKIKADTWKTPGTYTFYLYDMPPDASDGTISIGGSPVTVTATAERQNRTLSFAGTAGQVVHLKIDNNNSRLNLVSIFRPDGIQLARRLADNAASKVIDTTLPSTGTYTIVTELFGAGDGVTLTLGQGSSDIIGTISTDGQPVTINVPASRQAARYNFNVTAGQRTSLQRSDVTMPAGTASAGTDLECCDQQLIHAGEPGGFSLYQWPITGTPSVVVRSNFDFTGGVTVRLFDVAPDLSGTLTINGPPVTLTTTSPGQNAKLTMDGTTGQQVTLHVTNNTVGKITIEITKPSQSELPFTYCLDSGASFDLTTVVLPTPGAYRISVNPWRANTGTVTISATSP